jgi:hypothetical protein
MWMKAIQLIALGGVLFLLAVTFLECWREK